MSDGIGLSVGATNLAAVAVDRTALTRSAVLTRYPHRPPEVGVPSENPNLTERGLIFTDFVDRVGDPVPIVAADGSTHRAEVLLAEALRALLAAIGVGDPGPVAVTYPAHWHPAAVEALRAGLAAIPELAGAATVSDATAALTALQHDPGLPTHGVVALCDFGGTGTTVNFADASAGHRPLAPTVRHADLSGHLIDQGLLTHVIAELTAAGALDVSGTSAIGSLTRLRAQCRAAKERLSTSTATTLAADVGGQRGELRLTRDELDEVIRPPLDEFLSVVRETMERNAIGPADLTAVATIGGGTRIPLITAALSERLRAPVVTSPQPALTAAIGAGLTAARAALAAPGEDATQRAAAAPAAATDQTSAQLWDEPAAQPALAWSEADDLPEVYAAPPEPAGVPGARPDIQFAESEPYGAVPQDDADPPPWYRQPQVLFAAGVVAVLVALTAAVLTLRGDDTPAPASTTEPTTTEAPPAPEPEPEPPPEEPQAPPPPRTVYQTQPPAPTQAPPPPEPTEEPPPPPPEPTEEPPPEPTEEPPPETTEEPPPTTETPTTTRPRWSPTPPYPTVPGLPWVPAPQPPGQ